MECQLGRVCIILYGYDGACDDKENLQVVYLQNRKVLEE